MAPLSPQVCTHSARVPPHGGFVRWSTRPLDLFCWNGSDDSGPSIWHTTSQNQRCSEFDEYGADGHPEETRPSTFLASLLLLKSPRLDFQMIRQSNHRSRNDSPRIVGTYAERIRVLQFTERVWELLPRLHPELNFDHEAFAHITVGFLREKGQSSSRLMGLCSSSNPKRGNAVKHSERHGIHRILIQRRLVFEDPYECIRTIHHEFVHAMLKDFENPHGDRFWEHEGRILPHISRLVLQ